MSKVINVTESGVKHIGAGNINGIIVNSHTSGTIALVDGLEAATAASAVLTSAGEAAPASHAVSVFTSDGTVFAEDETVTIDTTVYRFKAVPVALNDILIGTAAESLDYLKAAVNGTASAGVFTGTVKHPGVVATTNTDTAQTFVARTPGVTPNAYPTTDTCGHASWPDTTLGGGTGASDPGVTTAAATFTIGTRVYTFVVQLSETSGADAIADQILYGANAAAALDNMKMAINLSGVAGTQYSTGTTRNGDVMATTNTNTQQTIVARNLGVAGNLIATTETLANYSWAAAVMQSGAGLTGSVICSTITLAAVTTVGDRFIPLYGASYARGLYVTVGGTLDCTILID